VHEFDSTSSEFDSAPRFSRPPASHPRLGFDRYHLEGASISSLMRIAHWDSSPATSPSRLTVRYGDGPSTAFLRAAAVARQPERVIE
jgi:hypothetical protein